MNIKEIYRYLKYLKIPVSKNHVKYLIESNNTYPSILSITDILEYFGINYLSRKITNEVIDKLQYPFLLKIIDEESEIKFIKNKTELESFTNVHKKWVGIIFYAELDGFIQDDYTKNLFEKQKYERILLGCLITIFSIISINYINVNKSVIDISFFICTLFGVFFATLILLKDQGVKNSILDSFCSSIKNEGCDKVLGSKGASLFNGKVKLSDIALSYFSAQLIILFLNDSLKEEIIISSFFFLTAIITIPVIFYSIIYQIFKVKSLCKLCLGIVFSLVGQLIILFSLKIIGSDSTFILGNDVVLIAGIFCGNFILITFINSFYNERKSYYDQLVKANRLKLKPFVFMKLLEMQRKVDTSSFKNEILFGNKEANLSLILAISLECIACKKVLKKLIQILEPYLNLVSIRLRIHPISFRENKNMSELLIRKWINVEKSMKVKVDHGLNIEKIHSVIELLENTDSLLVATEKKAYTNEVINTNVDNRLLGSIIEAHLNWFNRTQVSYTPKLFINGYETPSEYSMTEIFLILPHLLNNKD